MLYLCVMDLSIIIVNYNTANLTNNCIESIYKTTRNLTFEIIVVDNQSIDNSKLKITEKFAEVIWIDMKYNAGFARANNAGIKRAKGRNILLLNSDTIVLPNALQTCSQFLDNNSTIAACGCQLLNEDYSLQFSGGYFERGKRWLFDVPIWKKYTKRLAKYLAHKPSKSMKQLELDWLIGAFIMTKRSIIDKGGMLDEDFFLYAEEIEWCFRLKRFGKIVLLNSVKIIHLTGASSSIEFEANKRAVQIWDKRERQRILSVLVWLRKQYGVGWYLLSLLNFTIAGFIFFFGWIAKNIKNKRPLKYGINQPIGYLLNVMVWYKYIFKIIANKPYFYKVI